MKIKFLTAVGGSDVSYSAGKEYEVDDHFASQMLEAGFAEEVDAGRSRPRGDEVSTDERGERAIRKSPRRR